jgi:hypothetical protein
MTDTQEQSEQGETDQTQTGSDTTIQTEQQTAQEQEDTASAENEQLDEKTLLLKRARMMGLNPSGNAKPETIAAMIEAKMAESAGETAPAPVVAAAPATVTAPPAEEEPALKEKTMSLRDYMKQQMRLVRVRIANNDPKKNNLMGEVFTVSNKYLGTVKQFVPYGEATEDGWHLPYVLFKMLDRRKYLQIRVVKKNGRETTEQKWVKEFSFERLPDLTPAELAKLAQAQLAAGSLNQ